eukprot:628929-Prorocentrum_minimum.AAC.1
MADAGGAGGGGGGRKRSWPALRTPHQMRLDPPHPPRGGGRGAKCHGDLHGDLAELALLPHGGGLRLPGGVRARPKCPKCLKYPKCDLAPPLEGPPRGGGGGDCECKLKLKLKLKLEFDLC